MNNQVVNKKFDDIDQAFKTLYHSFRQHYDDLDFGTIQPFTSHSIFHEFFDDKFKELENQDFQPKFFKKWSKELNKTMFDEDNQENLEHGQTIKTSSYYSNKNGKQCQKIVKSKKNVKNGKVNQEVTEEYVFPNGDRNIIKKNLIDGKYEQKQFMIKQGEQLPKQLEN